MLNDHEVGAIKCASTAPGKASHFTIAMLPTITLVDELDEVHLGAPTLEEAFKDAVFSDCPDGSTHYLM